MKLSKCLNTLVLLSLALAAGCAPVVTPSPTHTAVPATNPPPTGTPVGPKVTLYHAENAQFELISPEGTRVLIDVYDPALLSSPPTENDVLLTTHQHLDHFVPAFAGSFPGQQLNSQEGEITLPDVTIRGIASFHADDDDTIRPVGASNYIFVVDIGGLRIAHLGDIGQEQFTPEQLEVLGEVDIAISVAWAIDLLEQLNPRLIIPTHGDMEVLQAAVEKWPSFYADTGVAIGPSDLPGQTSLLVMGNSDETANLGVLYQRIFELPAWGE
jgi:hypothetical protein